MEDVNKMWEISPYDASAYGALIVVLVSGVIYLSRQLSKKDDKIAELTDKMHSALDIVSEKLVEVKTSNSDLKTIQEKVIYILEDVKNKLYGNNS